MMLPWLNRVPLLLAVAWGLGGLETPAEASLCYEIFDDTSGSCVELLGDGLSQEECCLNLQYGFRLHKDAPCEACRPAAWSEWSPWTPCSVSCGEGTQQRSQACYGQGDCGQESRRWELKPCGLDGCCPVMGGWSEWAPWGPCSVTCLRGAQTRERTCTNPAPTCGGTCPGSNVETRSCDTQQICPTHGNWGSWGNWGACSATCTPEGPGPKPNKQRRRQCNNPAPSSNPPGNRCPGDDQESQACAGLPFCPQDGNWGTWKPFSDCSVTCAVGRRLEKRLCDSPAPKYGGQPCRASDTRSFACNTGVPCPVDGHWTEWTEWTPCSRHTFTGKIECREIPGFQRRTRKCVDRAHDGKRCPGELNEMRNCYSINMCTLPGIWTDWSPWGLCEPACGENPMRSRKRECKAVYPDYSMDIQAAAGSSKVFNTSFWGKPWPKCEPLEGQRLRLVETVPCQNVLPCSD
ncbi:PREDICTED: properdin [Gekko japonicus]|uniref:Properdin n=1 Tax=Gekko japonicus TaxID=146911 RepID=A0ABM1LA55_GEKJA|nr:PREDICTED: properdin [Gekko japonicus]